MSRVAQGGEAIGSYMWIAIHNIRSFSGRGSAGVGALPVNRADNDCCSRKHADDASKLLPFRFAIYRHQGQGSLINYSAKIGPPGMMALILGKAGPGILHLWQRRFGILQVQFDGTGLRVCRSSDT